MKNFILRWIIRGYIHQYNVPVLHRIIREELVKYYPEDNGATMDYFVLRDCVLPSLAEGTYYKKAVDKLLNDA